jgi:hypothetical protein
LRKLVAEAADNGLIPLEVAASIARVRGVGQRGVRLGNWLDVSAGIKRPRFRRFCGQRNPAIGQDAVPTLQQFLNLPT